MNERPGETNAFTQPPHFSQHSCVRPASFFRNQRRRKSVWRSLKTHWSMSGIKWAVCGGNKNKPIFKSSTHFKWRVFPRAETLVSSFFNTGFKQKPTWQNQRGDVIQDGHGLKRRSVNRWADDFRHVDIKGQTHSGDWFYSCLSSFSNVHIVFSCPRRYETKHLNNNQPGLYFGWLIGG